MFLTVADSQLRSWGSPAKVALHVGCSGGTGGAMPSQHIEANWLWVKNMYPKWLAQVNGNLDYNLRSISWWFNFDPLPTGFKRQLYENNLPTSSCIPEIEQTSQE